MVSLAKPIQVKGYKMSAKIDWGYKIGDMVKIGDMQYGTHFQDGARKMIKLQNILPSGIEVSWHIHEKNGLDLYGYSFNAVDYKGVGCRCPIWLGFKVIKLPNF